MKVEDLTGRLFGLLSVKNRAPNSKSGTTMWNCVCACGNKRTIHGTALRAGRNKSCGCNSPRFKPHHGETHAMSGTRIYKIWRGMIVRCSDKAYGKSKKLYYEKGIRLCDEWMTFDNFLADMGIPDAGMSIDRIDGNKGYYKENCRWADHKTQANNTSANLLITHDGKTMTASQWADLTGIKPNTIVYRIRRGWSADRALDVAPIHIKTKAKLERTRSCEICGTSFIPRSTQIRAGTGKYCSQKCNAASRKN